MAKLKGNEPEKKETAGSDGKELFRLFKDDGRRWFKGNTHTHTTYSDGELTPEETVEWYRKAGYDFLFLSEHYEKLANPQVRPNFAKLSTREMIVFPALELRVNLDVPPPRDLHVVGLGMAKADAWRINWTPRRLVEFILQEGGVPVIAHPYYSAVTEEEIIKIRGAAAVEVYNTSTEVVCDKGIARSLWDYLLRLGISIHGIAADDAHGGRLVSDYGKGWIMVKTESCSGETDTKPLPTLRGILESIRNGAFYASTGPEIHDVSLEGNEVLVRTSPVKHINFISNNGYSGVAHAVGSSTITSARVSMLGFRKFLRIECVDADGRYAWTNAVLLS